MAWCEGKHLGPNAGSAGLLHLLAPAEEGVHDQSARHLLLIEEALHQTLSSTQPSQWLCDRGTECEEAWNQGKSMLLGVTPREHHVLPKLPLVMRHKRKEVCAARRVSTEAHV